jgi:hypothetical protein
MSEETDQSDVRTGQRVDEPEQDPGQEQVVDRNEDGSPDSVVVDAGETAADVADEPEGLMPGEMAAAPVGAPWSAQTAGNLRDRWQELQLRFVDDPRGVVTQAQSLVGEAVEGLTKALAEQRRALDGWASGGNGDTEQLRVALQRYRDFFDRVLGPG